VLQPTQIGKILILYHIWKNYCQILSGDKVKEDKMLGACGMHGEKRNTCRVLVEKPKRKRTLESYRHMLENNIEISLKEIR
jgi:hypothetical protein